MSDLDPFNVTDTWGDPHLTEGEGYWESTLERGNVGRINLWADRVAKTFLWIWTVDAIVWLILVIHLLTK